MSSNAAFRAFAKKIQAATGYKPPKPAWIANLGVDVPLLTLAFARRVVTTWDRNAHPNDPCATAMMTLLDYHKNTRFINVLVNFQLEAHNIRTVGVIVQRAVFLYALRVGYKMVVGQSLFGTERRALNDEDVQLLELVYSAENNEFFDMCDGGYTKRASEFTSWAEGQKGYTAFCQTAKSRMTVEDTLVDMGVEAILNKTKK